MTERTELQDLLSRALSPLISDAVENALRKLAADRKMESPGSNVQIEKQTEEQWWTIDHFCSTLHVSRPTYHAMVNRGLLHPKKAGQRTLISAEEVKSKLASGELGRYKRVNTTSGDEI